MPGKRISRRDFVAGTAAGTAALWAGPAGAKAPNWGNVDRVLRDAVSNGDVPFLVASVTDRNGVLWEGAVGNATASHDAGHNTVFHLYSASKAVGSLACLILLDRGQVTLDTNVAEVLPAFASGEVFSNKVLAGINEGVPAYREPGTPVTLRHLLTHTSGLAYGFWDSRQADWEVATKWPNTGEATLKSFTHPLMFDPGTGWTYGVGIDWAGFLVEAIDGRSIDRFCVDEIFQPLGMSDTMFETDAVGERLADIKSRAADGGFTDANFFVPRSRPPKYGMGQALHGTARDYLKLCRLVLNDGTVDGRRLVSPATMALMKENQIGEMRIPFPMATTNAFIGADLDLFPGLGTPCTHTAGFVRNEEDVPERRRAGSLTWAGFLNCHYWIDPASGIAATLFTQSVPFIEPRFQRVYAEFETAVYREIA